MAITRDATSGMYCPANAAEWTELLAGTGIANPALLWLCQEPTGTLADSIGTFNGEVTSGAPTYSNAVPGWSRKAVICRQGQSDLIRSSNAGGAWPDASTLVFAWVNYPAGNTDGNPDNVVTIGHAYAQQVSVNLKTSTTPTRLRGATHGDFQVDGTVDTVGVHPTLLLGDKTNLLSVVQTDLETISSADVNTDPFDQIAIGGNNVNFWLASGAGSIYLAAWSGSAAELDATHRATLLNLLINGPAVSLTSVTVSPPSASTIVGGTTTLAATGHYSDSSTADITSTATWTTDNAPAATVAAGLVTGVGAGLANITATLSGQSGSAAITVTAAVIASVITPTFSVVAYQASSLQTPTTSIGIARVALGTGILTTTGVPTIFGAGTVPVPTPGTPVTTDVTAAAGKTLDALQNGSVAIKWVVEIEGYPYLLTDAIPAKAVIAHSGRDYTQALGGLVVQLNNEQSINPHDAFANVGGTCVLHVQPDATDRFGIDCNRMADGPEALLTAVANRNGTPSSLPRRTRNGAIDGETEITLSMVAVDAGGDFVAGDAFIGTECLSITGPGNGILWTVQRGKYSPFASGGTGGSHFAQHHRVMQDSNNVALNPVVSQQPRTWIGKQVGLWMHKVDGTGTLNSRDDALLVYAGRIASIDDDPNTGNAVVELAHVQSTIKDSSIGRDMYSATLYDGVFIQAGRTFGMYDINGTAVRTANPLTIVASGASSVNEVNEDYYSLEQICSILNAWIAAEAALGNLWGAYSWASPVTSSAGLRTKCYWSVANAGSVPVGWGLTMPSEIAGYLGIQDFTLSQTGLIAGTNVVGQTGNSNNSIIFQGSSAPWRIVMFRNTNTGVSLDESWTVGLQNDCGTLFDQYALLPWSMKPADSQGLGWGIFLLDEKYLIIGSFTGDNDTSISNCAPANYPLPGVQITPTAMQTFGRKADDTTDTGPVTIRQVYILEAPFATILKTFFYNTGTNNYNHPDFDNLGYGLGLGIPGELLGPAFESSIDKLPGAQTAMSVVITAPTKFSDVMGADLNIRRAFPIWRTGHLEFSQWQTPNGDLATLALDESNKAEASGTLALQRSVTTWTSEYIKNVVSIQYNRDITIGAGITATNLDTSTYQNELQLEDHTSVDDMGGVSSSMALQMRNTFLQNQNTGAGVEALAPGYLALFGTFARAMRMSTRSIDQRAFEGYAPGDCAEVTDSFMRDPATGTRGVFSRPAVITRVQYDPGGPTPGDPSKVNGMAGEVDLFFLDLHRYAQYAPSARVNDTINTYGFASGYNTLTQQLSLYPHAYSDPTEQNDATRFAHNDSVIVSEIDPADPTNAQSWIARLVATPSNDTFSLSTALTGFDPTKKYRVTYDSYAQCQPLQQSKAFQASVATGKIANVAPPFQWAATNEPLDTSANTPADQGEFLPTFMYGDGRPFDVGSETALIHLVNAFIDYKSAHCSPMLASFNNVGGAPIDGGNLAAFTVGSITPMFLGLELLSNSVFRDLTVAPWLRSSTGGLGQVRVTFSRSQPVPSPGAGVFVGVSSLQVSFNDVFVQFTWTVGAQGGSNTAWSMGAPTSFTVNGKDTDGVAWLTIEVQGRAQCLGLAQCFEGPRQTQ